MAYNLSNCLKFTLQSFTTYFLTVMSVRISNKCNYNCVWTQFQDKAPADVQSPRMIEVVWLQLFSPTFLWLLRTEGVTKAFSHRSHLYFLWPSCTTWMWTLSVSFLLKVASHWSHLNVLSPAARKRWTFARASAIVKRLNTESSRTTRGDPISPGLLCGQITTKKTQTTIF